MHLYVDHETTYSYEKPVSFSRNELRLKPRDHSGQSLQSFSLETHPTGEMNLRTDYFGNKVHRCNIRDTHRVFRVHSRAEVGTSKREVHSTTLFREMDVQDPDRREFLHPTDLVPLEWDWAEKFGLNRPGSSVSIRRYLSDLLDQFDRRFEYDPDATGVETDLRAFSQVKRGVCQDFAHLFAGICRQFNLPARYVSGYIHSGQGSDATHAWVEVYIPDTGWVGLDPTNNQFVDEQYIVVAFGRDYSDCSPIDGVRRGGGTDEMSVDVTVKATSDGMSPDVPCEHTRGPESFT